MTRILKLELAALAAVAIGLSLCSSAAAQDIAVNPSLAKRGAYVYNSKGCYVCHGIGKQLGGPDLLGVMERRDHDWLRRWLKKTTEMIQSDPQAMAMVETYQWQKMPDMKLTDSDIEALFHFMTRETQRVRGGGD